MSNITTPANHIVKFGVILVDLIVLNLLIFCFYRLGESSWLSDWYGDGIGDIEFIYNLCYLLGVSAFPPVLHLNIARTDQIAKRVFCATILFAVLAIFCTFLLDRSLLDLKVNLLFFVTFLLILFVSRITLRFIIKSIRRHGRNVHTVVFVGAGDQMIELYNEMMTETSYGYNILGYFSGKPAKAFENKLKYLGTLVDVIPYLQTNKKDKTINLYCGLNIQHAEEIKQITNYCVNNLVRFFGVPNFRHYIKTRMMNLEMLGNSPVLYLREEPLQQFDNRFIKRAFDLICSTLFLVTIFPIVFLIVGSIIKITSPGPIFFRQKRNGMNGREFYCYKFRSMKVNAQADTLQATEHDPRKTKFGDFMRKTNIDELPQFINVFLGDMSLVGPRPHMVKHTEEYSALINEYMVRHLIKPGITGWAQVNGCRGETKELYQMEERVKKDIWYLENWSFWLDLRIMFLTVRNMVMRNEKMAY